MARAEERPTRRRRSLVSVLLVPGTALRLLVSAACGRTAKEMPPGRGAIDQAVAVASYERAKDFVGKYLQNQLARKKQTELIHSLKQNATIEIVAN